MMSNPATTGCSHSDLGSVLFVLLVMFAITVVDVVRAYPRLAATGQPFELVLFGVLLCAPFWWLRFLYKRLPLAEWRGAAMMLSTNFYLAVDIALRLTK
jgi:hypothetical protein